MGDPRKHRKKYSKPGQIWNKSRIEEDKKLMKDYGLKTKHEIWKGQSLLKKFMDEVKKSITSTGEQSEKEKQNIMDKLKRLGLISETATVDDVLGLSLTSIMERRLQTQVYRKMLASSMTQARQFIVHKHIAVGDSVITMPSYMVKAEEEDKIRFVTSSTLADDDHPERAAMKKEPEKVKEKPKEAPKKEKKEVKEEKNEN